MKTRHLTMLLSAFAVSASPVLAASDSTDLDDLIMYAINNDEPVQLLRYSFRASEYMVIAALVDQFGATPEDLESLCYVPSGPDKGFYAASNLESMGCSVLVHIDPLTGACYRYPDQIGFGYTVGMVPVRDVSGKWWILATHAGAVGGADCDEDDEPSEYPKNLIRIDPVTGIGEAVMPLTNVYEGLARDLDGNLLGMRRVGDDDSEGQLYHLTFGGAENPIGSVMDHGKIESLEFAFGDGTEAVDTDGAVPPSWTDRGVLMAFSDDTNSFVIINPSNGQTATYAPPFLADSATDAEGLVFFVSRTDPFGPILADVHD